MSDEGSCGFSSRGIFFSLERDPDVLEDRRKTWEYGECLREIVSGDQGFSEKLQSLLNLGAGVFQVEIGHLTRTDPAAGTHTIVEVSGSHPTLQKEPPVDLSSAYCRMILTEEEALAVEDASRQGGAWDPADDASGFATCLGARILVEDELYGTVCFVDSDPRDEPFDESDAAALGLFVHAIEQVLEQKRMEARFRRVPDQLEALFKGAPDLLFVYDRAGTLLFSNSRLCTETGYTEEELRGKKVWDIDRDVDSQEALGRWDDMEPGEWYRRQAHYERKDGSTFLVEVHRRCVDLGGPVRFVASARDVTEQKRRERAVRREKERFESLVQEVEEYAIFEVGPDGSVRSWNEGAERIKGYSKDEIVGQPLATFYTEEAREAGIPEKNLARAKEHGSVQEEGWRVREDGSRFWARVTITALHDEDGDVRAYTKVTQDLTDRKERERRYEAIFNQTYQFIGLMETDGTLIEANDTALQFGGIDREDVLGKPFWEAHWWQVDDTTQKELRAAIERAAEGEFVRYDVEVQGGDENVVIDFSIRPVTNEEGDVTLLIPEGRNITELKALKRRERRLEQTRNLLAQAEKLANVGGWKVDLRDGPPYLVDWTDKMYDLFEVPSDETLTLEEVLDLFPPDVRTQREAAIDQALAAGEGWDQEFKIAMASGKERWFRSIVEPVQEDDEPIELRGAFQDITERKRRERQLERQNERLDEFAGLVSHDLRSPLHVAKGRLELAQQEQRPDHLRAVNRALDRMDAIIEDLLTLTWGEQELNPEEFSMQSLQDVARASWNQVDTAEAVIQIESDANIQAEDRRLQRLLENLFRNAVEHGGKEVRVRVGPLDQGFYVEDDGPGIAADRREQVLKAGYSSEEEGTGLGLSIVKSIAESHDWTLSINESQEGGVRFEFVGTSEREVEGKRG